MPSSSLPSLSWQLAHFDASCRTDFAAWSPGSTSASWKDTPVPGCVQTSPAYGIAPSEILLERNWSKDQWMESKIWVYRTELPPLNADGGQILLIRFQGLDYHCRIFLNGEFLTEHEGMFSPVELEFNGVELKKTNLIHIAFLPAAILYREERGGTDHVNANSGEIRHLKARYMKGWDFCPELKCSGIWDDVVMEWKNPSRIQYVGLETRLANSARAEVYADVHLLRPENAERVEVEFAGTLATVAIHGQQHLRVALAVKNPLLWHPHTHGEPVLQKLHTRLYDKAGNLLDENICRAGIREVSRKPATGQKSTDTPAQYLINGAPVFLCGANLTPFSSVPAHLGKTDYLAILEPLKKAGVNFLRVWGGGLREKKVFYDLCDEMGFLLMQEFPLACQIISRDPGFLALLEAESRSIIRQLKHHPCIVVWSGGNEHYHFWESVDSGSAQMLPIREKIRDMFSIDENNRSWRGGDPEDHPALQLLNSIVAGECPFAFYNVTSGLEDQGETHGPWTFRPEIGDHRFRDQDFYQLWQQGTSALYSEASVSGPAHPETFKEICGVDSLETLPVPQDRNDILWTAYKAFKAAWDGIDDNWLDISGVEKLFGPLKNTSEVVAALSYLQCEGTRYMIESVRRKQGLTTGLAWWGINEPFPSLAGNSLVDFYGRTKPALQVMASSYRPLLLSLHYPHLLANKVRGSLHFTNSTAKAYEGKFQATVQLEDNRVVDTYEGTIHSPAYSAAKLADLTPLPLGKSRWAIIDLHLSGEKSGRRYRVFNNANTFPLQDLVLDPAAIDGLFLSK